MLSQNNTFKVHLKKFVLDLDRALLTNPLVVIMLMAHFVFSALFIQKGLIDYLSALEAVLYFAKGFIYTSVLYLLLDRTFALLGAEFLRLLFQLFFVIGFFVLQLFHLLSGAALDYPLLAYNFKEIFNKEAFVSIFVSVDPTIYFGLLVSLIVFAWYLKRHFSPPKYNSAKWTVAFLTLILFMNLNYISPSSCPYTYFLQTTVNALKGNSIEDINSPFPYWAENKLSGINQKIEPQPHIFLIIVESFSSEFLKATTPDGQPYTPFLNQLAELSAVVPNFFSTSIQTARSQFSIFCGVPAGFRKKEFTDHLDLNLNCLPNILKRNSYATYFFKAYEDITFDNTEYYAQKMGFNVQLGMNKSFISTGDTPYIWGWGLQDDKFYEKFFSYLDRNWNANAPIFASLTTVTNHMMFDHVPPDLRPLYKKPQSVKENYANTINLTDKYIGVFFEELRKRPQFKNSIVIITGDNGYPLGQHQLYHNESGYYDEFFRTPLIVHGLNRQLRDIPISAYATHVDIAPTVLDLLGIKAHSHFVGSSIFLPSNDQRTLSMSQPYASGYLVTRKANLKYVRNLTYQIEYLYDTQKDPHEKTNLIGDRTLMEQLELLREESKLLLRNQNYIEQNRLAPPSLTSQK